ncbi:MAG TPA: biotin/lipoyl-containing protein [Candidatus Limnocylindrales bacterium]|nr:biotin/lipoyl-containing protein [Candidatus Limnocylindrales bacterium]
MSSATEATPQTDTSGLIDLIDRLETLLNESELSEIEVEAGGTTVLLRKPSAVGPAPAAVGDSQAAASGPDDPARRATDAPPPNAVVAPLTGLFYTSPSPGAEPYLSIGAQVMVGQVIGLIEAMKLFNEIKSDRAGRVTRIYVESGALVKAKQPLIEVEP